VYLPVTTPNVFVCSTACFPIPNLTAATKRPAPGADDEGGTGGPESDRKKVRFQEQQLQKDKERLAAKLDPPKMPVVDPSKIS